MSFKDLNLRQAHTDDSLQPMLEAFERIRSQEVRRNNHRFQQDNNALIHEVTKSIQTRVLVVIVENLNSLDNFEERHLIERLFAPQNHIHNESSI